MTDLAATLHGFAATVHDGAAAGAVIAAGVLIAASIWLGVRRALWVADRTLPRRRPPSHWRGD